MPGANDTVLRSTASASRSFRLRPDPLVRTARPAHRACMHSVRAVGHRRGAVEARGHASRFLLCRISRRRSVDPNATRSLRRQTRLWRRWRWPDRRHEGVREGGGVRPLRRAADPCGDLHNHTEDRDHPGEPGSPRRRTRKHRPIHSAFADGRVRQQAREWPVAVVLRPRLHLHRRR